MPFARPASGPHLPLELIIEIISLALSLEPSRTDPFNRHKLRASLTLVNKQIGKEAWRRIFVPEGLLDLRMRYQHLIDRHLKLFKAKRWARNATRRICIQNKIPGTIYDIIPRVLKDFKRITELDIRLGWQQDAPEWDPPESLSPFTKDAAAYTSNIRTLKLNNVWPFQFAALIMAGIRNTGESKFESLSLSGGVWHGFQKSKEPINDIVAFFVGNAKVFNNLKRLELGSGCDRLILAISRVPVDIIPSLQSFTFTPNSVEAAVACRSIMESFKDQLTEVRWTAAPFRFKDEKVDATQQKLLCKFLDQSRSFLSTIPGLTSVRVPLVVPDERSSRVHYPTASTIAPLLLGSGPSNKLKVIELDIFFMQDAFFDEDSCPHKHRGEVLNYFFSTCDQDDHAHRGVIPIHELFRAHLQDVTAFPSLERIMVRISIPNRGAVPEGIGFTLDDEDFIVNPADRLKDLEKSGLVNRASLTTELRRPPTLWDVNFREELRDSVKEHVVGNVRDGVNVDVVVEGYGQHGKPRFG